MDGKLATTRSTSMSNMRPTAVGHWLLPLRPILEITQEKTPTIPKWSKRARRLLPADGPMRIKGAGNARLSRCANS